MNIVRKYLTTSSWHFGPNGSLWTGLSLSKYYIDRCCHPKTLYEPITTNGSKERTEHNFYEEIVAYITTLLFNVMWAGFQSTILMARPTIHTITFAVKISRCDFFCEQGVGLIAKRTWKRFWIGSQNGVFHLVTYKHSKHQTVWH